MVIEVTWHVFQSIIYLFRNASSVTIDKKLRFMKFCKENNQTINEINFSDEDKVCFAKLALAKILRVIFKHESMLDQECTYTIKFFLLSDLYLFLVPPSFFDSKFFVGTGKWNWESSYDKCIWGGVFCPLGYSATNH